MAFTGGVLKNATDGEKMNRFHVKGGTHEDVCVHTQTYTLILKICILSPLHIERPHGVYFSLQLDIIKIHFWLFKHNFNVKMKCIILHGIPM